MSDDGKSAVGTDGTATTLATSVREGQVAFFELGVCRGTLD